MTRRRISPAEQARRYQEAIRREAELGAQVVIDLPPARLRAVPDIPPGARDSDPEQSKENAAAVDAKGIALLVLGEHVEQARLALAAGRPNAGLTDDDAARLAGHPGHESYRRRGSDLRANGWIEWLRDADGRIVRRRTQSIGGTAGVCVATQDGMIAWETR